MHPHWPSRGVVPALPCSVPTREDDLLDQQARLQAEARAVLSDLDLEGLLRSVGRPTVTGSAALGLMVWRDLDVTTVCAVLDVPLVMSVAARLAEEPNVRRVEFRNDSSGGNAEPDV